MQHLNTSTVYTGHDENWNWYIVWTICGLGGFRLFKVFLSVWFVIMISNLLKTAKIQRGVNRYSEKKNHASSGQLL